MTLGIDNADAVLLATALLALVAVLSIALTTSIWRPDSQPPEDETLVQLWAEELTVAGNLAAAGSISIALTRLPYLGYLMGLLAIAAITVLLAAASTQRSKDTVFLSIQRHDVGESITRITRDMAALAQISPEERGRARFRRVALCGFAAVLAALPGLWHFLFRTPMEFAYSVTYAVLLWLAVWTASLVAVKTPITTHGKWPQRVGRAVLGATALGLVLSVISAIRHDEAASGAAFIASVLLVPMGVLWALVHAGRHNVGIGRGFFEVVQAYRRRRHGQWTTRLAEIDRLMDTRAPHRSGATSVRRSL
ncbi:MAG: hypothetical protein WCF36_07070 [Candidatus Nanopelagicales bacterium]